jgi:hypothetical protein
LIPASPSLPDLGEVEIVCKDLGTVLWPPLVCLIDIGLHDTKPDAGAVLRRLGKPVLTPHIARPEQKQEDSSEPQAGLPA